MRYEVISGEPGSAEMLLVRDGMLNHHAANGHSRSEEVFSIVLRSSSMKINGAVIGSCLWGRMYIKTPWVDETLRGRRLGNLGTGSFD